MNPTRRAVLASAAGLSLSGCLGFGTPNDQPGNNKCGEQYIQPQSDGTLPEIDTDWPLPQYDARNSGSNPAVTSEQTTCGRVRWIQELADEEDGVVGAATLLDGTVYVSRREEIVTVDAHTGAIQWSVSVPHEIRTAPTVTTDQVFIGTEMGVVAIDTATQTVGWNTPVDDTDVDLDTSSTRRGLVAGAPAVSDGRVFAGTYAGQFAALDAETGAIEWSVTTDVLPNQDAPAEDANKPIFDGTPAVGNGVVVIGNWNERLYAFDVGTGEELWTHKGASGYQISPTIVDDTVLATTQVDLTAHSLTDGSVQWRHRDDPGSVTLSAAVDDESIFVAAGDAYASLTVTALDRTDQSINWRVPGRPQTSPSIDNQTVYLGLYGNLVAIDRDSGEVVWEMKMESVVSGPPIVTDDAVIALDERGYLYGIETSKG